jgi:hypothetical protein
VYKVHSYRLAAAVKESAAQFDISSFALPLPELPSAVIVLLKKNIVPFPRFFFF